MVSQRILQGFAALAVLFLSGCSYDLDWGSLWPGGDDDEDIFGDEIVSGPPPVLTAPRAFPRAGPVSPPVLGTTNFVPPPITGAPSTGTFVGQKVTQQRVELQSLQNAINIHNRELQEIRTLTTSNAERYHGTVAAITARLQLGTTPGNPVLVNQWNAAQMELDRISADITAMNALSNKVAADSAMAAFLLESLRATYGLSGAIDEDHRQLAVLEDETNRTVVLIDRLLNELSDDVSRQTTYVANERGNLTTLSLAIKNGELYGASLANRAYGTAAPLASSAPFASGRSFAAGNQRPLVVIRFDRPDVPYEQALYTAVSKALERSPGAQFDLVAVSPARGSTAQLQMAQSRSKQHAQDVLRTLREMGLPAQRINLSAATSPDASTNEVHIYVH